MTIPHIDVNADGCRARQVRSCKNTARRRGIPEILAVYECLRRLDDLQSGIISKLGCYCFEFKRWHTLERLFSLMSAGLERMRHVPGGRLKRPSPCRIRSSPGRDRLRGLSETKVRKFVYFGQYTPELFLDLGISRV